MGKRKRSFIVLAVIIMILTLELLPYGAALNFAHLSPDLTVGYYEQRFSYFDPIVYSYGNFGPFITAILTCVLLIISSINLFTDKTILTFMLRIISLITIISSLAPILIHCYSLFGGIISALLLSVFLLSFKKEESL